MASGSALYGFGYTPEALAYLKLIQSKIRQQIIKRIQGLGAEPIPHNSRVVQNRMDEEHIVHRIRSGDYRILYSVRSNPDQIIILDIDHRKDVYR